MTKAINITRYQCGVCGATYDTEQQAAACEGRPVSQDKGVKVGDKVRVTAGDGTGQLATVESISIIDRGWGHYAWERYWHTVALTAKLRLGHRFLTFDSYEPVEPVKGETL
jgi:hypothetical protein